MVKTPCNPMKTPTPGVYRRTPAGGLVPVVQATFVTVWRGARGENVPQYAVERVDNNGTAIAWVYSIRDGEYLCRLLNGGVPEIQDK